MNYTEALAEFQAQHGAQWYLFLHSPLWRAARTFLNEYGPNRDLVGMPPEKLASEGMVLVAQIKGWQSVIAEMEGAMLAAPGVMDPTLIPSYLPDLSDGGSDESYALPAAPSQQTSKPKRSSKK